MAQAVKTRKSRTELAVQRRAAAKRRRDAAERMRGLFADPASDRSLVDELIAQRRAEARAEDLAEQQTAAARAKRRGATR